MQELESSVGVHDKRLQSSCGDSYACIPFDEHLPYSICGECFLMYSYTRYYMWREGIYLPLMHRTIERFYGYGK